MPHLVDLPAEPDDDESFVSVASVLQDGIEESSPVETLVIVRVRNWFDHKWLRFSGKGRVPFDAHRLDHPGVSLAPFFQRKLTFPPFTPKRIVRETHFTTDDTNFIGWVHRNRSEHSAHNLHRRAADRSTSLRVAWVSTGSKSTGRASVMVHQSQFGTTGAWYASFVRGPEGWRLLRVKGTQRERLERWLTRNEPGPRAHRTPTVSWSAFAS